MPLTAAPAPHLAALPPVTVLLDPHDDRAVMAAALAAHDPAHGHLVLHPTPVAASPAALAADLLRSLGKDPLSTLQPTTPNPSIDWWATQRLHVWRAATAWILTTPIHRLTVTRAHLLNARAWEDLLTLRAATGLELTVLCHGHGASTPEALADIAYHTRPAPQEPRTPPTPQPRHPSSAAGRVHRLAHPVQAAALAITFTARTSLPHPCDPSKVTVTAVNPSTGTLHLRHGKAEKHTVPLPPWTVPLLAAARAFRNLDPHLPNRDELWSGNPYREDDLAMLARRCDLPLPTRTARRTP